eukprot:TRINITY_DN31861_c0_g1_i1.p1 TRINITY_DN31861_c0_g1~~TRINITY_DN31861_c0_g1_i1.p1  ORF type:complete len:326 (-),score=89.03 TRINITY_DN31861_c0_g1_i1:246-1223(-)
MSEHFTGDSSHLDSADAPPFYETNAAFDWPNGMEGPDMRLQGDFYRESEDVTRGVTFAIDGMTGATPFDEEFYSEPVQMPSKFDAGQFGLAGDAMSLEVAKDYQPPVAPYDNPPATSLVLKDASAADLATNIYAFLAGETGSILKVSDRKFAVKADIFQEVNANQQLYCRVKARVYQCAEQNSSNLIVDVCRRSGDSVAFQQTFARLAQHLLSRFSAANATTEAFAAALQPQASLPPLPLDETDDPAVAPLLELLQGEETEQAEAVAALATVASASTAGAAAVGAALGQLASQLDACTSNGRAEVYIPAARLEAAVRGCGFASTH